MRVPDDSELNVSVFGKIFQNTTNSYKYFWFLAILDHVMHKGTRKVHIVELINRMIQLSWYPVVNYRMHFGKLDKLEPLIQQLATEYKEVIPDYNIEKYFSDILPQNSWYREEITKFNVYVPYRYLTPFFKEKLRGIKDYSRNKEIIKLARSEFEGNNPPFYKFENETIVFHPLWLEYFEKHYTVLETFGKWHLTQFLSRRNPNVPNIMNKLEPPRSRDLSAANNFWNLAITEMDDPHCIYTGIELKRVESLDHFLPWSFVAHDLLWNLIPTPKPVNSSKSDNLPSKDYFPKFYDMQYNAVMSVIGQVSEKALEDYLLLTGVLDIGELKEIKKHEFRIKMENTMKPQYTIAMNMGFTPGWKWKG